AGLAEFFAHIDLETDESRQLWPAGARGQPQQRDRRICGYSGDRTGERDAATYADELADADEHATAARVIAHAHHHRRHGNAHSAAADIDQHTTAAQSDRDQPAADEHGRAANRDPD